MMSPIFTRVVVVLSLILASASAKICEGSPREFQQISGTVEAIHPESIIVRSGSAHYEFFRDEAQVEFPADIQVGDEITVGYTLKMQKFTVRKTLPSRKQEQPGQTGQDSLRPILDDRAFYDA